MQKKKYLLAHSFWIHLVVVSTLLLIPITFTAPDEEVTVVSYLRRLVLPSVVVAVFYINYLWLVPRYLMHEEKHSFFWISNLVLVLILALALTEWSEYIHQLRAQEELASGRIPRHLPPFKEPGRFFLFSFLRSFFNLVVAVALSSSLRTSRRWMELERENKEREVALKEAELKNLRNQISPHFLLNTLNNIYALISFDQSRAQNAVKHLSQMLRHILYDATPLVNLAEETKFIHDFINLMKLRLPSHVTVTERYDIPSPCHIQIASMIIISLVENAFKHGISPTSPSTIDVSIAADETQITCEIRNSNYPKTSKDQSGHGIGLQQVALRLDLTYSGRYEWEKGVTSDGTMYISKLTIHDTQLHHH